jgi:hypothetical protein
MHNDSIIEASETRYCFYLYDQYKWNFGHREHKFKRVWLASLRESSGFRIPQLNDVVSHIVQKNMNDPIPSF